MLRDGAHGRSHASYPYSLLPCCIHSNTP
jgi:hypothetical protein